MIQESSFAVRNSRSGAKYRTLRDLKLYEGRKMSEEEIRAQEHKYIRAQVDEEEREK